MFSQSIFVPVLIWLFIPPAVKSSQVKLIVLVFSSLISFDYLTTSVLIILLLLVLVCIVHDFCAALVLIILISRLSSLTITSALVVLFLILLFYLRIIIRFWQSLTPSFAPALFSITLFFPPLMFKAHFLNT